MTKSFVPLESNPEVFSDLSHQLGLSNKLGFHDVFSIDELDLLAFIPRPVYALILVFPVSEAYEKYRKEEDAKQPADYYTSIAGTPKEDALWFKQTIRNACGTYAILHALTNGVSVENQQIVADSFIDQLAHKAEHETVDERSKDLESSETLEKLHSEVASHGSTEAPDANDQVDLHYVCFTRSRKTGNFVELDGRRNGPIDLGPFDSKESDLLSEKALDRVRSFIKRETTDPAFSILALAPTFD